MSSPDMSDYHNLPPYTHVPGRTPHPISSPNGHMHQHAADEDIRSDREWFDRGLLLFRHGYYWEAHEAWEQLWIALGRTGDVADSVKGMIKLAACAVKVLEGNQVGAVRHANRALQLLSGSPPELFGFCVAAAICAAKEFSENPKVLAEPSDGNPSILCGFSLTQ